jgi:VCBS repeat protein/FG-GAP repeat protein
MARVKTQRDVTGFAARGRRPLGLAAAPVCCVVALLVAGCGTEARSPKPVKRPAMSFGGPHTYRAGRDPTSVAVADLNGDLRADLVVAHAPSTVSVFLSRGRGRRPAKLDYPTGRGPASVAIGDFNGDRRPDLAVANSGASTVSVLLNQGRARLAPRHDYATAAGPLGVVVGDVNGDGKPDLATANGATISLLPGAGDGRFGPHADYTTPGEPFAIASGDLNGDGTADLAVLDSPRVSVFLGSRGGLKKARSYSAYGGSIAIADLNGDRNPDLVTDGLVVLLNRGDGSFGRGRSYDIGYAQGLAIGDLNRDGRPDVVVGEPVAPNQQDCETGDGISVYVHANKGDGKLGSSRQFSTGYDGCAPTPALGDLNGDGLPDLVTANTYSGTVSVLVNGFGRCAVPDFEDGAVWSLTRATGILRRAGCDVGSISHARSKWMPRGAVVSQRPHWGAVLPSGGQVALTLSKGNG